MAKVKLPLLGLEARGSLGKSIVYFPWKGINAVRQHVMPAQPRTQPQIDQRARLEAAVTEWHAASYSPTDVAAWNRYAGLSATARSGFNRFVEAHVKEAILTNTWTRMRLKDIAAVGTTGFWVNIYKAAGGVEPYILYGTRATAMLLDGGFTDNGDGTWSKQLTGLTPDTPYFFTFAGGTSGTDYGRAGIYTQRTEPV